MSTGTIELKNNPKAILFQTLAANARYDDFIKRASQVAFQYDEEQLQDPRNAAVTLTAIDKVLSQYSILMNLDMKAPKNDGDAIEYADNEEIDRLLGEIPKYLEEKKAIEN